MSLAIIIAGVIVLAFGFVVVRGAPYVPTLRKQLNIAFGDLYKLSDTDLVVDLGSGDGAVLLAAAQRGARAVGYELNPILVALTKLRISARRGIEVRVADYSRIKALPDGTTVVYAFTTSHSIEAIGQLLEQWSQDQELYFISFGFQLAHHKPLRSRGAMHLYRFKQS